LRNRTRDLNAIIALTGYQYRGIGVALVDQVLGRKQVASIERPMRSFDHIVVGVVAGVVSMLVIKRGRSS
jgi:hypothetical protein